jgi:hypothetical protein
MKSASHFASAIRRKIHLYVAYMPFYKGTYNGLLSYTVKTHMKSPIYFLFFLLVAGNAVQAQDCAYGMYKWDISEARTAYQQADYSRANQLFKKAFDAVPTPFDTDMAKAVESAHSMRNSEWLKELSVKLAQGGIPLSYFKRFSEYDWYEQFKASYPQYRKAFETRCNLELREEIFAVRELDSTFNVEYHRWRRGEIELTLEELIEGAKQILDRFNAMVEVHGFPGNYNMGYNLENGEVAPFPIEIVMVHLRQFGERLYTVDEFDQWLCHGVVPDYLPFHLDETKGWTDFAGIEKEMQLRYERRNAKP